MINIAVKAKDLKYTPNPKARRNSYTPYTLEEKIIECVSGDTINSTYHGYYGDYNGIRGRAVIECNSCHHVRTPIINSLLTDKRGCTYCGRSKYKKKYKKEPVFYILKGNDGIGKIGVTGNILQRRKGLNTVNKRKFEIKHFFPFETREKAFEFERIIKNEFSLGVVSIDEFPDGHKETFNYNEKDVLSMINWHSYFTR